MEQEQERPDIVGVIRMARAKLRAAGEVDSQRAVHRVLGGSRHTVSKYWAASAPRQPGPTAAPEEARDVDIDIPAASPGATPLEVTIEVLRAHYFGGATIVHWPGVLPVAAYEPLRTLWKEADAEIAAADRDRYVIFNRLSQERGDLNTHPAMVAAEHRRSLALLRMSIILADIEGVRRRAHAEGIEYPDPRVH